MLNTANDETRAVNHVLPHDTFCCCWYSVLAGFVLVFGIWLSSSTAGIFGNLFVVGILFCIACFCCKKIIPFQLHKFAFCENKIKEEKNTSGGK